jgi:starch synthase
MKVCIGSAGRFHTFDLARQLERLGHLGRVYTGYPKWKIDGLPREKVSTFPWFLVPQLALGRFGLQPAHQYANRFVITNFARWMARNLEPSDVFHCLSSFGVESLQVAQQHGALTVCDRGSSHIVYQEEILREEYERWNVPFGGIDRCLIERELAEYDICDLVCVPSTFAHRSFLKMGVSPTKLRKISYGVDLQLFKPVRKRDQTFRLIYVGALSLQKGIPYLLEAIAEIHLPHFEMWFIGSVLPEVRQLLGKYEGKFRYLGVIPRNELYNYYSQSSALVLPSIQDGFGLVQAQAMACGLPIIATTNTGAQDLFTDGLEGFVVPIRSPEAIREKVLYLYDNPDVLAQMAAAALTRVRWLGGWDTYGEQMVDCYRMALSRPSIASADESRTKSLSLASGSR